MSKYLSILLIWLTATLTGIASTWSVDKLVQPRQNNASNWVVNPDGILSAATVSRINTMLNDINSRSGAEVVLVVIDDYAGGDIDSFTTELFETWGVGKKYANTGILIVVAKDVREAAIRTGRGMGGVLTDVEAARIVRADMVPAFKAGKYDDGITATIESIHGKLSTDEAVNEIKAANERAVDEDDLDLWEALLFYLGFSIAMTIGLAIWAIVRVRNTASTERHARYVLLHPMVRTIFGLSFVGLFIPMIVYLPLRMFVNNLRNGRHICPNCGDEMNKLDEETDNLHLTPAQDAEEKLNSVDYDVWLCPTCGEEDIYPFKNEDSTLAECPHCHARTARFVGDRIIKQPTATAEGIGVHQYECINCGKRSEIKFRIPRRDNTGSNVAAGIAAAAILGSLGRGGGGSFGGGAGLGGGSTGGGGTSVRW